MSLQIATRECFSPLLLLLFFTIGIGCTEKAKVPDEARGRICTGAAGEQPGVNCIPQAAVANQAKECRAEGESIEGKNLGERCCDGLGKIDSTYPEGTKCTRKAPPSVMICASCGDHICGKGENWCNCPQDCKNK